MKNIVRHRLLLGLLLFTALLSAVPTKVFAVTGSVYFFPGGNSVINGTEITIEVRGKVPDPGLWGGGATIVVTYDATRLELVDRDDNGGAFRGANSRQWTGTSPGTVRYVAYYAINAPGVNDTKIISMKFRAISTGNATLSFGSDTNVNNGPTTGTPTTYTIIPLTCPSGQVGTPPNCTTPPPVTPPTTPTKPTTAPKPAATPAATPAPTPSPAPTVEETPTPIAESDGGLKIENVKTTATRQKNSVTWTINQPDITPTLTYGTTKSASTKGTVTKLDDGSYETDFAALKLGTLYYFTIKASSGDNLQGATYTGTFTTRGYPVQLTVQQNGVLAPGAKVTIGSRSFTANKNAIISTELGDGEITAMVLPTGASSPSSVSFTVAKKTVPTSGNPELQSFVLNAAVDGSGTDDNDNLFLAIAGIVGGLIALIGGVFGFLLYKRRRSDQGEGETVDQDLLVANYGTALETYRDDASSNTPAPNLDTTLYAQPVTPQVEQQSNSGFDSLPENSPPLETTQQLPGESLEAAPISTPNEQVAQTFDPAALPLPPQEPVAQPAADSAQQYIEDEQISPELVRVESVQVPEPDEPSAIYDAATGELDIIHHQAASEPLPSVASATNVRQDEKA